MTSPGSDQMAEQPSTETTPRPGKQLARSPSDRMVAGVCGGLGRYFALDPIWFRLGFVLFTVGGGSGVLLYLALWIVMPERPDDGLDGSGSAPEVTSRPPAAMIGGLVLVTLGLMILVDLLNDSVARYFWPVALILLGALLAAGGLSRDRS